MQVKYIEECSKGEHSAILLTFIKLPFVIKIFVLPFLSGRIKHVLLYIIQNKFETFEKRRPLNTMCYSYTLCLNWAKQMSFRDIARLKEPVKTEQF